LQPFLNSDNKDSGFLSQPAPGGIAGSLAAETSRSLVFATITDPLFLPG
jgi:hypothetical protein